MPEASKSEPVTAGRHSTGIITAVKQVAAVPIKGENFPKCHGPRRNLFPTKNVLMVIGIVKATKAPIAPILKMAPIAISPAKIKNVRAMPMAVLNHTAFTGVCVWRLTLHQYFDPGKQPSRA